jgi:hypothetical protein
MPRYFTQKPALVTKPPVAWWDQVAAPLPHPIVDMILPVKTGLLDNEGREIYRLPTPIGFLQKLD